MAQNDMNALNDIQIDSNQGIGHSKRNKLKIWAIVFLVILLVAGLICIPFIIFHYQKKSPTTKEKSEDVNVDEKEEKPAENRADAADQNGKPDGKSGREDDDEHGCEGHDERTKRLDPYRWIKKVTKGQECKCLKCDDCIKHVAERLREAAQTDDQSSDETNDGRGVGVF